MQAFLGIAWFKACGSLNLLGFFTIRSGDELGWLSDRCRLRLATTRRPFLVLFFLFYVRSPCFSASRQLPLKGT